MPPERRVGGGSGRPRHGRFPAVTRVLARRLAVADPHGDQPIVVDREKNVGANFTTCQGFQPMPALR